MSSQQDAERPSPFILSARAVCKIIELEKIRNRQATRTPGVVLEAALPIAEAERAQKRRSQVSNISGAYEKEVDRWIAWITDRDAYLRDSEDGLYDIHESELPDEMKYTLAEHGGGPLFYKFFEDQRLYYKMISPDTYRAVP